jgi:hypothetical protein
MRYGSANSRFYEMSEKIFLTYTNATAVPYQGSVLGHHIVLNYINSSGAHHTLQGIPEHGFDHNIDKLVAFLRAEGLSEDTNNLDSPFKRLQALPGRDSNVSLSRPHTMVAEGDDLSPQWALMEDFADEVNSTGYEYRPKSQNSNSFAGGALQRAGFFGPGTEFPERFDRQLGFDPVTGETRSFKVPGFERPLANPINTAAPMPFPLDAPASGDRSENAPGTARSNSYPTLRRVGSAVAGIGQNEPAPPPERTPPLGIFSGKPMSFSRFPLPLGGLSDNSDRSGGGNLFDFLASLAPRNPSPAPPPTSAGGMPVRILGRSIAGQPQASALDAAAPFAPLAPSEDANFSGGLLGRLTALAGLDSQNPTQPAPPPLDDQLRGFSRDDPAQPWFAQLQR